MLELHLEDRRFQDNGKKMETTVVYWGYIGVI